MVKKNSVKENIYSHSELFPGGGKQCDDNGFIYEREPIRNRFVTHHPMCFLTYISRQVDIMWEWDSFFPRVFSFLINAGLNERAFFYCFYFERFYLIKSNFSKIFWCGKVFGETKFFWYSWVPKPKELKKETKCIQLWFSTKAQRTSHLGSSLVFFCDKKRKKISFCSLHRMQRIKIDCPSIWNPRPTFPKFILQVFSYFLGSCEKDTFR